MEGLGNVHVKFTRNTQNILFQFRGDADGSTTVRGAVRYAARSPPLTEANFQLIVQRTCAASTEQLPHDVRANTKSAIAALLKLELRKHEAAELASTELATTELATTELDERVLHSPDDVVERVGSLRGGRGGSRLAVRSGEGTNGGPGGRGRGGNGGSTLGDAFASISASISASAQRNAMKRKRQQQGLA